VHIVGDIVGALLLREGVAKHWLAFRCRCLARRRFKGVSIGLSRACRAWLRVDGCIDNVVGKTVGIVGVIVAWQRASVFAKPPLFAIAIARCLPANLMTRVCGIGLAVASRAG